MIRMTRKRAALWLLALGCAADMGTVVASAQEACGEVLTLKTHGNSTTAVSLAMPPASAPQDDRMALVFLPGGPGYMALDAKGCASKLEGNSLVRSTKLFNAAGFVTALVDAPSDHRGEDGLGGFRLSAQHADDIGKVIAEVRARTKLAVWLVGTSRGAISAANAVTRLSGPAAPDGLVLTSPVTSGKVGGYKAWVAQTVLSTRLEAISMPVLVVVHARDTCIRTPPHLAGRILARTKGSREQLVTVTGGSGKGGAVSVDACQGRTPHGFIGQEAQVAAGIARFVRGGSY
jgi:pimeloyl-ACP methyl ester carboxylesterase